MNFSNTPAGMPPPGVTPNFVNPPTQAPITYIVTTVTLPLMIVFVALRLYADVWISRKLDRAGCECFLVSYFPVPVSVGERQETEMLTLLQGPVSSPWYESCAIGLQGDLEAYHATSRLLLYRTVQSFILVSFHLAVWSRSWNSN